MKIFLVRHGEAEEKGGKSLLTKKGIIEAKSVARELSRLEFSKVYSSNLQRAKDTAREYLKLNKNSICIETHHLSEIYRVLIGGAKKNGTPLERVEEDRLRADEMWDKLLKEKKGNILVFAHGNIIRYFLNKILKDSGNLWKNLPIYSGSISIIDLGQCKMKIKKINFVDHLKRKKIFSNERENYID